MAIDASQAAALAQDYASASGRVGVAGRKVLEEQAEETKQFQHDLVPVRSEDLQQHLRITYSGDGRSSTMYAQVGPVGESRGHGYFVEHGTSRMSAQPFIEPSAEAASKTFPSKVEAMMEEVTDGL